MRDFGSPHRAIFVIATIIIVVSVISTIVLYALGIGLGVQAIQHPDSVGQWLHQVFGPVIQDIKK